MGAAERKQPSASWDMQLAAAAVAGGAEVLADSEVHHTMEWADGVAILPSRLGPPGTVLGAQEICIDTIL